MQEHDNSKELWQDEQNANNMSDYLILRHISFFLQRYSFIALLPLFGAAFAHPL